MGEATQAPTLGSRSGVGQKCPRLVSFENLLGDHAAILDPDCHINTYGSLALHGIKYSLRLEPNGPR